MDNYANQSNRPMYGTTPVTYHQGVPQSNYQAQVMPQTAVLFGGMQFIYVEDPMMELASCPSLLIK